MDLASNTSATQNQNIQLRDLHLLLSLFGLGCFFGLFRLSLTFRAWLGQVIQSRHYSREAFKGLGHILLRYLNCSIDDWPNFVSFWMDPEYFLMEQLNVILFSSGFQFDVSNITIMCASAKFRFATVSICVSTACFAAETSAATAFLMLSLLGIDSALVDTWSFGQPDIKY